MPLSRRGTLWSYTENRYAPPPPYPSPDPFEPFAVAAVELADEGLIVLGKVVEGTLAADLKVGMEMELTTMPLYRRRRRRRAHRLRLEDRVMSPEPQRRRHPAPNRSTSSARACTRGASGAATSPSTASSRRAPRWPRPAWTGGRSSWSPAPTPSATATPASSPGRRSRRSSAGTACPCQLELRGVRQRLAGAAERPRADPRRVLRRRAGHRRRHHARRASSPRSAASARTTPTGSGST